LKCPRCQHENEAGAKFCEECASPLARTCPNCGRQLSATAKFCPDCAHPTGLALTIPATERFTSPQAYTPKHLAEKILTSKSALEGERKQVTVLFADLKGSMEMLADRDPEDARNILDPVLERMMEAVHRYEGTVNQVMGDGIMALFGAPLAHEDHALRACYAALRMQEAVQTYADEVFLSHGVSLQIRVGLNSGEVVVRAIGSDLRMDYTAVGQTTHLAARMEQMARPGSTLLTAATLGLVEGYVRVKPLGMVPVKGLAGPVEVYDLTGAAAVRTRMQATAARGLTRFVGRRAELEVLTRALEHADAGHGQVAGLVGEPGVGKSRLVWELGHSHRSQGWLVLESGSVSYGKAVLYRPLVDLLRAYFQLEDRDDVRRLREKVTGKLLALDRTLEPTLPAILALLDAPVEDGEWANLPPTQRRQETLKAVKRLVLCESRAQPLLLVFEDLHWIDSATQAFLDDLVESLPTARVLLLVNYRPEYQHGWGNKTYYSQLRIDPLPPENANELLRALLGDAPELTAFRRLLIQRTEGNPFFLEETVRTLVETRVLEGARGSYRLTAPVETLQTPGTVQAVLAARIDRLAADEKRLLQTAAVIGKDVPGPLLQAIADVPEDALKAGLARLQATEFLYVTSLFPDVEYTFKHALTHEVAYGGVLQDRRRALHAQIVDAIERLHPERLAEHVERIAYHAIRGEVWDKAVDALREAGARAHDRGAVRESVQQLEQALELVGRLPASLGSVHRAIDVRHAFHGPLFLRTETDRLIRLHQEAEQLAREAGDQPRLGRTYSRLGYYGWWNGRYHEGLDYGRRAHEVAVATTDAELGIHGMYAMGINRAELGEYQEAIGLFLEIVEGSCAELAKQRLGLAYASPYGGSCGRLAQCFSFVGDFDRALAYGELGLQNAHATGYAPGQLTLYFNRASAYAMRGDFAGVIIECGRALALADARSLTGFYRARSESLYGLALAWRGQNDEALSHLEQGAAEQERTGGRPELAWCYVQWAEGLRLAGRVSEAGDLAQRGLKLAAALHERPNEARALLALGDAIAAETPLDVEAARTHYQQALTLATELGMRPLVGHCQLGLGKLYRLAGQREQAHEHLNTATAMYREMEMRFWLEQAEAEMK
jgi:class 3 adenylate cyclase/tetratricopeptide (TPR) repeat protein